MIINHHTSIRWTDCFQVRLLLKKIQILLQRVKGVLKQPPISQSITGYLEPEYPEEAHVEPLLARSNLLITRDIEWANLVLGFEQENRYAIVDVCYPESPVGFIRGQSNVIAGQVRRLFWWITSSIYAEINGKEVGVGHRRWHLWRRIYDLYLGNKKFDARWKQPLKTYQRRGKTDSKAQTLIWHDLGQDGLIWDLQGF
nr:phospholipid scramblase family protein C343.06c-like isoform X2 [Ziziphus jujuba var. spinosa]